jgi:hypothetical protein
VIVVKDLVRDAGAIDAAKDLDVRAACQWDGTRCSWIGYRWGGGVGVKSGKIVPKLDGGWKDGLGQEDVFVGGIDVLDIGTALGFHPKGMREMISKLLRMRGLVL